VSYEPFLKSASFGLPNITGPTVQGTCPAGQIATRTEECFLGPCPELCVTAENFTLSGKPPGDIAAPAAEGGGLSKLAALWVALPMGLLLFAGRRRRPA